MGYFTKFPTIDPLTLREDVNLLSRLPKSLQPCFLPFSFASLRDHPASPGRQEADVLVASPLTPAAQRQYPGLAFSCGCVCVCVCSLEGSSFMCPEIAVIPTSPLSQCCSSPNSPIVVMVTLCSGSPAVPPISSKSVKAAVNHRRPEGVLCYLACRGLQRRGASVEQPAPPVLLVGLLATQQQPWSPSRSCCCVRKSKTAILKPEELFPGLPALVVCMCWF